MKVTNIFESSKDTERRIAEILAEQRLASSERNLSCIIDIDFQKKFQTIKGFGCAITESSGYALSHLSEEQIEKTVESCFSKTGNAYTFARTHMNSCDFSLGNWACVEQKDETLESFSFERTDKYMTPILKQAAKANSGLCVMVTPWSPPAWMKTNGDMNHGGKLKPEYKSLWAKYYVKFIKGLEERGLHVGVVSIQNESEAAQTWDSCLWTGEEEGEFALNFLKPEFEKNGLGNVKILVWDHNRDNMLPRMKASLSVPGAENAVDGIAYHWYSGAQFDSVAECARLFPGKELFFTEANIEGGSKPGKWYVGERYGHNIINDLNSGCTAWIDWNMALTLDGGPNHVGNNCDSAILIDTQKKELLYQSSFYYIGHFSRFIAPGSSRLFCNMSPFTTPATVTGRMGTEMESCAALRPDGTVAFVVMNRTEDDMVFELNVESGISNAAPREFVYSAKVDGKKQEQTFVCPPRSIQTYILEP